MCGEDVEASEEEEDQEGDQDTGEPKGRNQRHLFAWSSQGLA